MYAKINEIMLREIKTMNFVTFKIYRSYRRFDIFGFKRHEAGGITILDGLKHIKSTLYSDLRVPDSNLCTCRNKFLCKNCIMKINGKIQSACQTPIRDINVIDSIDSPPFIYSEKDINSTKFRFILQNINSNELEVDKYKKLYGT